MKDKIKNVAKITGRVYSFGTQKGKKVLQVKQKDTGEIYINGVLNIAIDEDGVEVIPIEYFKVTPTFASGKVNETFNILKDIIDNKATWLDSGKENAAMVSATPSIAVNDFVNATNEIVSATILQGGFVNKLNSLENIQNKATFEADMVITQFRRVENEDGSDHGVLGCATFDYRGNFVPIELKIYDPLGMNFFEERVTPKTPIYTVGKGAISFKERVVVREEASDWGPAEVKTSTYHNKEWVLIKTNGTIDIDEDSVINIADLKTCHQNREVHLAEVRKSHEEYIAGASTDSTPNFGSIPEGGFII